MLSVRLRQRQGGMILAMLVLVLAILLALAAFALDIGRLYVLRSEMQNAADAAALAAAAELDAESDAIERARAAAIGMLDHNSHFANVKELLGEEVTLQFTFYCSIGRTDELLVDNPGEVCPGDSDPADANKTLVTNESTDPNSPSDPTSLPDSEAHYVRVTLDPALDENADNYGISFYFIPVLGVFGTDTQDSATLSATALAGRHFYMCNYPPVMLCDPFESSGGMKSMVSPGQQILLKAQGGNTWAPGNFGFLDLDLTAGGGAGQTAENLAQERDLGCNPPLVMTSTGGMTNKTAAAVNTRFDIYDGPPPFKEESSPWLLYPPAPNIVSFGEDYRDSNLTEENRIGNGNWDRFGYFTANHAGVTWPVDWATIGRAETYLWELEQGYEQAPNPAHVTAETVPDRRIWHVAVLSCEALGLSGSDTVPVIEPDGFAKLFVTETVAPPPNTDIYVEFMGWARQQDQDYHVVVQLYE